MSGSCSDCTADPDCGYCPTTGQCFLGNSEGPVPRFTGDTSFLVDPQKYFMYVTNCSAYQFSFCKQAPCEGYHTCSQCLADSFCGWCGGSGKCAEGDAAGSYQEFCPRAWIHSPLHSGVGVRHRSDLLLTSRQVAAERDRLGDYCEANTEEARRKIQAEMEDEKTRNERMKRLQQSCAPCKGVWPNCECDADPFPVQLRPLADEQVARAATEEATGRQDVSPKKAHGLVCMLDDRCESGTCVERCCKEEAEGCSGHGSCDESGSCACEAGFAGDTCSDRSSDVEDVADGSKSAEEEKKAVERKQREDEERTKASEKEERAKAELAAKNEEAKKEAEKTEEMEKTSQRLEEAAKSDDSEAAEKYRQKQEEIAAQKLKEERAKKALEESKKGAAEEREKLDQRAPAPTPAPEPEVQSVPAAANETQPDEPDAGAQVQELLTNLTQPGADVPKIAQSIITVSYNNTANVASRQAETLEKQSLDKYEGIVEQKRQLEKTIAAEEVVKTKIKSKEVEAQENKLAAEKVEKAQELVKENERKLKQVEVVSEKKAIADELAAKGKAEAERLANQRESAAMKAEQNIAEATAMSKMMAKEARDIEDQKKQETAEALAREQAVTDLKALHTKMDLEKEAVRKAELEKELQINKLSTNSLNVDAAEQVEDGRREQRW